jgi:hypothetical protein
VIEGMRARYQRRSAFALAVLACALALRLLVPQGWMPVTNAQGFRIVPCSGTGPMDMATMAMPGMSAHHGQADHDPHPAQPDHPCAFAGLSLALADPPLPTLLLAPAATGETFAPKPLAIAIGRGLAAPPPPSTGPPVLA